MSAFASLPLLPLPALLLVVGGLLIFAFPSRLRPALLIALPLAGLLWLWLLPEGQTSLTLMGFDLTPFRLDPLSRLFASVFFIAACLGAVFAWQMRDPLQQSAAALYAGSAIGAALSGDLLTFFFFWEATSLSSFVLVCARRSEMAWHTGLRYLWVQLLSGLLLLAGLSWMVGATGSLSFNAMQINSPGAWLIFLSFGIKAAFPLFHTWLKDAYPASTITGTVFLSAFTTKLAIYALARGFPATEFLIYIGAVMALFPLFYTMIENDLRRVLAYSLNDQLGFMVVGIGIGTPLALNGAAAHAFCHVLYKALLFMSIGAVMFRTGTAKASELGGLYKCMPYTMMFYFVGAVSIASFPLFSGFVSKSLILSAAHYEHYWGIWLILTFASAGVLFYAAFRIPYYTFFNRDAGWKVKEAPNSMLAAMGLTAALCLLLGIFPQTFYALLPYDMNYHPYDFPHIITSLQLVLFAALAFALLIAWRLFPPALRQLNLDSDWFYRTLPPRIAARVRRAGIGAMMQRLHAVREGAITAALSLRRRSAYLSQTIYPAGAMAFWIAVLLALAMIFTYA